MVALKNNKGFSLVETMTVIGIVAIMGTFAVPPMISWLQNKGLNSAARDLYSNMRKAQSIAVKNNRNCVVSFDGATGYTVYVDMNKNYVHDAGEEMIAQVIWSQYNNMRLAQPVNFDNSSGKPSIAFQPNLIPADKGGGIANGTINLESTANARKADIAISVSGNISLDWQ